MATLVFATVAVGRGVDNTWDLQHYHLAVGWSTLQGQLVSPDWIVAGWVSFFNPLLDTVFAFFYLREPWLAHAVLATPVLASCFVARGMLADLLPDRMRGGWRSWLLLATAMLTVLGTDALGQLGGSMGDATLVLPVMLGAWLVLRSLTGRAATPQWSMLGGCALLGVAMGLKVTLIPVAVGLVAAAAVATLAMPRPAIGQPASPGVRHALGGWAIGWSLVGLPWALLLWSRFGNPIFPFLNGVFRSDWATTEAWGTPYHVSPLGLVGIPFRIAFVQDRHGVSAYSLAEQRFLVGLVGSVIGVAAVVWRRRRTGIWRDAGTPAVVFLCGGWLVAYLAWAVTLANARYAIPLLALALPCLVCAFRAVVDGREVQEREPAGHEMVLAVLGAGLAIGAAVTLVTGTPEWGPRSTDPQRAWEFPEGPRSDLRTPLITEWKGRDVLVSTYPWPLGFMAVELEPRRIWNLRESMSGNVESTGFEPHVADVIDRERSLVVYDPRLDDWTTITTKLGALLDEPVVLVACGVFENGWTAAVVCEWEVGRLSENE